MKIDFIRGDDEHFQNWGALDGALRSRGKIFLRLITKHELGHFSESLPARRLFEALWKINSRLGRRPLEKISPAVINIFLQLENMRNCVVRAKHEKHCVRNGRHQGRNYWFSPKRGDGFQTYTLTNTKRACFKNTEKYNDVSINYITSKIFHHFV